jgi:alpha-tubulin suppressor-like RCC1 family protein
MNIKNLNIQLQKSISESTSPMDLMSLSKTIQLLGIGQIRTAANISSLPAANTHAGWVYFVESEERHFYSNNSTWIRFAEDRPVTSAFAWGYNNVGQLGDTTVLNKSSPVSISSDIAWQQVSSGRSSHSVGIDSCQRILSWGGNTYGQLGDGTAINKSSPVTALGACNWKQVAAGNNITLAVNTEGEAWAWGINATGQLGDNTTVNRSSPVSVVGGFTDWCQVSGSYHSLGVTSSGGAWAWGFNQSGQLGDGTVVGQSSPVSVVGDITNWCQVAAGYEHSLGVTTSGTAWAWGKGTDGRLGDGTTVSRSSPVSVVGGFTDWCQASAGDSHSLGVRTNGTVWAWGSGCQLGDGTIVAKSSPVSVVGGFTDWCQVSASVFHSLAVRTNGTAWAWGGNYSGYLGDGTVVDRSSPVSVVGGFTDWCQVSAGYNHSLAIASAEFKG